MAEKTPEEQEPPPRPLRRWVVERQPREAGKVNRWTLPSEGEGEYLAVTRGIAMQWVERLQAAGCGAVLYLADCDPAAAPREVPGTREVFEGMTDPILPGD